MRGLHLAGQALLFAAVAGLGGLVAVGLSMPKDLPDPTTSMTSVHAYWYMGRASGFIAYGLLLASIALGLAVSSRVADGLLARPRGFDIHPFLSLFVLTALLFHAPLPPGARRRRRGCPLRLGHRPRQLLPEALHRPAGLARAALRDVRAVRGGHGARRLRRHGLPRAVGPACVPLVRPAG